MPKLKTREMIIIAVMIVAILYGAYEIFGTKPKKALKQVQSMADTKKFISEVTQNLAQGIPSSFEAYLIGRAESEWLHDPFFKQKLYRALTATKESAAGGGIGSANGIIFNYTGYIEVGGCRMAVINGIEYKSGEALETEGYILKNISPAKVVIKNKADGTSFDVPIQE